MSKRFKKLSHTIYECKYHIVFCPKYRFRIFKGDIAGYTKQQIYILSAFARFLKGWRLTERHWDTACIIVPVLIMGKEHRSLDETLGKDKTVVVILPDAGDRYFSMQQYFEA